VIAKQWPEFAVKNVWPKIENDIALHLYLPVDEMRKGVFPDRDFFWGILFTKSKVWADDYFKEVMQARNIKKENPFSNKTIELSQEWLEKLSAHDYRSREKRG
jgi:hypothetical protein